jgi:hypothetical protein
MALSVLFFDRIAGISHGADAALRTSATNPRQILRFPAAESCRHIAVLKWAGQVECGGLCFILPIVE